MHETFKLDMRHRHAPDHILQGEDVKRKIEAFMSALAVESGARGLTVDKKKSLSPAEATLRAHSGQVDVATTANLNKP